VKEPREREGPKGARTETAGRVSKKGRSFAFWVSRQNHPSPQTPNPTHPTPHPAKGQKEEGETSQKDHRSGDLDKRGSGARGGPKKRNTEGDKMGDHKGPRGKGTGV